MAKRVKVMAYRTRVRHEGVVLAYAEEAGHIGLDPVRDREAQLRALERGGYTRAMSETARLRKFRAIWNGDAARELIAEVWAMAVPEAPDPLAVMQRTLYEHMVQPTVTCEPCAGAGFTAVEEEYDGTRAVTQVKCFPCGGTGKFSPWGERDRSASLAAVAQAGKMFVPQQTVKVDSRSVVARIDRPEAFEEPKMVARPLGDEPKVIAQASVAAKAAEPDDDDEEDDEDE